MRFMFFFILSHFQMFNNMYFLYDQGGVLHTFKSSVLLVLPTWHQFLDHIEGNSEIYKCPKKTQPGREKRGRATGGMGGPWWRVGMKLHRRPQDFQLYSWPNKLESQISFLIRLWAGTILFLMQRSLYSEHPQQIAPWLLSRQFHFF